VGEHFHQPGEIAAIPALHAKGAELGVAQVHVADGGEDFLRSAETVAKLEEKVIEPVVPITADSHGGQGQGPGKAERAPTMRASVSPVRRLVLEPEGLAVEPCGLDAGCKLATDSLMPRVPPAMVTGFSAAAASWLCSLMSCLISSSTACRAAFFAATVDF